MTDMYRQNWHNDLSTSQRYEVYRTFKHDLLLECYLGSINIKAFKDALTKFRLGISILRVHKHRYTNSPEQLLWCPSCTPAEKVDIEVHLLFDCPRFEQLRPNFLCNVPLYCQWQRLAAILSCKNTDKRRQLAWFLNKCFQMRCQDDIMPD